MLNTVGTSEAAEGEARDTAERIANGHAYEKHCGELNNLSRADFTSIIFDTLVHPFRAKKLPKGRSAYWNEKEQFIVIVNPSEPDGGTAFRPDTGIAYFTQLKEEDRAAD